MVSPDSERRKWTNVCKHTGGRGQKGEIKTQKQGCKQLCKDQPHHYRDVCGNAQEVLSSSGANESIGNRDLSGSIVEGGAVHMWQGDCCGSAAIKPHQPRGHGLTFAGSLKHACFHGYAFPS